MTGPGSAPRRPWLLVSDVDDTLTGDDEALAALGQAIAGNSGRLWFALNSSRPSGSVGRTLAEVFPATMVPDAVITGLGTEVAVNGQPVEAWQQRFSGWPQPKIHAVLSALGHRPHDDEFQTPFKVSFAIGGVDAQSEARNELQRLGLACRIIASGANDFDAIPLNAGKDAAALFLAELLGVERRGIIAAGDSGNDLDLFRIAAHAIAVANARHELLTEMPATTSYHASRPHAGGVLEGLRHFGVFD